jgi:hypothetical protein
LDLDPTNKDENKRGSPTRSTTVMVGCSGTNVYELSVISSDEGVDDGMRRSKAVMIAS